MPAGSLARVPARQGGTQPGDPRKAAEAIRAEHSRRAADLDGFEQISRAMTIDA